MTSEERKEVRYKEEKKEEKLRKRKSFFLLMSFFLMKIFINLIFDVEEMLDGRHQHKNTSYKHR